MSAFPYNHAAVNSASSSFNSRWGTGTDNQKFSLLDHIDKLIPAKEKGRYICPVCEGNNLTIARDGAYRCWSGCECKDIREAISPWTPNQADKVINFQKPRKRLKAAPLPETLQLATMPPATDSPQPKSLTHNIKNVPGDAEEITFPYSDTQFVSRYQWKTDSAKGREKTYRQWYRNSEGKISWGKGSNPWVAYRLTEAIAAAKESGANAILAQEGEPCVETARSLGIPSITWQGSGWNKEDLKATAYALNQHNLALVFLPDPDEAGQKKAQAIREACCETQTPCLILDPLQLWEGLELPHDKVDLVDLVVAVDGNEIIKRLQQQIDELASNAAFDSEADSEDNSSGGRGSGGGRRGRATKLEMQYEQVRAALGDRLRWNELLMEIELDGKPLDTEFARLKLALTVSVEMGESDAIACLTTIAKESPYHPVRDYLSQCYEMHSSDTSILDDIAQRYFGTASPLHQSYFIKHLIASCKRAFEPGEKNDAILVLQSQKQGKNKSSFLKTLHGKDFFTDSMQGLDRDGLMVAHQYWCIEMAEIDGIFSKKENAELKSFLSRDTDTFRQPYGRKSRKYPRGFVLTGTTNDSEFLRDETGNRRYMVLPVKIPKIPIDVVAQERDRVWGAAMALYQAGVPHYLTDEEMTLQAQANLEFAVTDPWEDVILSKLRGQTSVATRHILEEILQIETSKQTRREAIRVKTIMVKNGWRPCQKRFEKGSNPERGYEFVTELCNATTEPLQVPLRPEPLLDKVCTTVTDVTDKNETLSEIQAQKKSEIFDAVIVEPLKDDVPSVTVADDSSETLIEQSLQAVPEASAIKVGDRVAGIDPAKESYNWHGTVKGFISSSLVKVQWSEKKNMKGGDVWAEQLSDLRKL